MMDLKQHFINNKGRGIYKYLHYFDIYNRYFSRFCGTDCVLLEVGVCEGGSLQMWKKYLGPKAKIFGIDKYDCEVDDDQIKTFNGLQEDGDFLDGVKRQIPKVDILIDDASHKPADQIFTFEAMWDHIKLDGIYLCEDMSHAYAENEGGGLKAPGSSIEYFKDMIDYQNRFDPMRSQRCYEIASQVYSVNFFMNVVVVEKKNLVETHKSPFRTGDWKYKEKYA